mmetsp:Transcript_19197/g.50956  ORF Transcript_19197/g.50956 Transcript_19197/m.50956 type:complete len:270 (-) Transcript_19197:208-1017(-)
MHGLARSRHMSTIRRCQIGTIWYGISVPRSPRATTTPSAARTISSRFSSASAVSIFASTLGAPSPLASFMYFFSATTDLALTTKLSATQFTPSRIAKSISSSARHAPPTMGAPSAATSQSPIAASIDAAASAADFPRIATSARGYTFPPSNTTHTASDALTDSPLISTIRSDAIGADPSSFAPSPAAMLTTSPTSATAKNPSCDSSDTLPPAKSTTVLDVNVNVAPAIRSTGSGISPTRSISRLPTSTTVPNTNGLVIFTCRTVSSTSA